MKLTSFRSLPLGLVALPTIAVLITVSASPRLLSIAAAPPAPPTPSLPVTVVNTPLSVTGSVGVTSLPAITGNVNAAVTGNVNASVTGNVAVTNTPTVNFSNSATTPIYVDTDRPARNSFMASCGTGALSGNGQSSCTLYTFPTGTTAVVETVACNAGIASAAGGIGQADLILSNGNNSAIYLPLAMTNQTDGPPSGVENWVITNQIHAYAYAPPASTGLGGVISVFFVATQASLSTGMPQGMNCMISGYVVPQ